MNSIIHLTFNNLKLITINEFKYEKTEAVVVVETGDLLVSQWCNAYGDGTTNVIIIIIIVDDGITRVYFHSIHHPCPMSNARC